MSVVVFGTREGTPIMSMNTDPAVRPFHVDIVEEAIADLRRRIAAWRPPEREPVDDQSPGVQLAAVQDLANYWATEYDWRRCEAKLNALEQFTTSIWVSPSSGTSSDAALVRYRVTSHGLSLHLERRGGVSAGLLHFPAGNAASWQREAHRIMEVGPGASSGPLLLVAAGYAALRYLAAHAGVSAIAWRGSCWGRSARARRSPASSPSYISPTWPAR